MLNDDVRVHSSYHKSVSVITYKLIMEFKEVKRPANRPLELTRECSPYPKLFTDARNLLEEGHAWQAVET